MKRKEKFNEFITRLTMTTVSIATILVFAIIISIMIWKDSKLEVLAAELCVELEDYDEYSIPTERIPIQEQIEMSMDSLPIPEPETLKIEFEEVKETENLQQVVGEFEKQVEGITPIVKNFNTSAYCACEKCCDKTDGITASGKKAKAWHTIAAGKNYTIGTIIYIPELSNMPNGGWFVVEDRGGAISNDRLDVYHNTHEEALVYGRKTLEAYVFEF